MVSGYGRWFVRAGLTSVICEVLELRLRLRCCGDCATVADRLLG